MPGDAEVALREREDLRGLHAEDESLAAAFVLEGAVPYLPLPAPVPLRLPFLGQVPEQVFVGDPDGLALNRHVQTAIPVVATSHQENILVREHVDVFLLGESGGEVKSTV
jgi:hypothetical protein